MDQAVCVFAGTTIENECEVHSVRLTNALYNAHVEGFGGKSAD